MMTTLMQNKQRMNRSIKIQSLFGDGVDDIIDEEEFGDEDIEGKNT